MQEVLHNIGPALRRVRKQMQLTQEDVAERVDICSEFYSRIERGQSAPSLYTFVKLADVFGVSTDELLGRTIHDQPQYTPPATLRPEDPLPLRRLVRRVRNVSPSGLRVLTLMVNALEHQNQGAGAQDASRQNASPQHEQE